MRAVRRLGLVAALVPSLLACNDDAVGIGNPFLVGDTIMVAAPLPQNADLPQALDITSSFGRQGGRFPERSRDATDWDFAVRIQDGQLVLVPAGMLGIENRFPPAITSAISGETIETLREAPGQSTFLRDVPVVMQVGAVYAARSREFLGADFLFGGLRPCTQFAKIEPVTVDVAAGILRLYVITNENCNDLRLAPA